MDSPNSEVFLWCWKSDESGTYCIGVSGDGVCQYIPNIDKPIKYNRGPTMNRANAANAIEY